MPCLTEMMQIMWKQNTPDWGFTCGGIVAQDTHASEGKTGIPQELWWKVSIPPEVHSPGPLHQDLLVANLTDLVQLIDGCQKKTQELDNKLVPYTEILELQGFSETELLTS